MSRLLLTGLLAAIAVPAIALPVPPMAPVPMDQRVMTRAEAQSHVADMFARVDVNRDGVITKAEVDAAHQAMRGQMGKRGGDDVSMTRRDPAAAFDRIDANRDGMINREEFTRAHAMHGEHQDMAGTADHMRGGMAGIGARMFERADANRDGRVTLAEAQAATLARFDLTDTNRDGRITPDERQGAHQRMMQERSRR